MNIDIEQISGKHSTVVLPKHSVNGVSIMYDIPLFVTGGALNSGGYVWMRKCGSWMTKAIGEPVFKHAWSFKNKV